MRLGVCSYWLLTMVIGGALVGCKSSPLEKGEEGAKRSAMLQEYLANCQELIAIDQAETNQQSDWLVGASVSTWEAKAACKIVYADVNYVSFRVEEYVYRGGAHGSTIITVGSFERKTGRLLKATDLIPAVRRVEVLRQLRQQVVAKLGGEQHLQGEVTFTDNCYVAQDGIHFVYNEYEVACYAAGMIEVVIK